MDGSIVFSLRRCRGLRGRRWAVVANHRRSSGHRSAQRPERRAHLVTPPKLFSSRPPANSSTHEKDSRSNQRETFTERRIRLAEASQRVEVPAAYCNRRAGDMASTHIGLSPPAPRGADSSGRLALIAWFDMTYLGGTRIGSGRVIGADFARGGRPGRDRSPRIGPGGIGPAALIDATDRQAGHSGSRAGYDGITPDPAAAGQEGASSSSPSADIRSDRPSARSRRRSVFRVIPRSRAAWSLLPSVDSSTSGRSSRSRCWCASW